MSFCRKNLLFIRDMQRYSYVCDESATHRSITFLSNIKSAYQNLYYYYLCLDLYKIKRTILK